MPKYLSLQMEGGKTAVSIMLLLTAVTDAVVALTGHMLTADQLHTVLCVGTIAHRHFAPARPLVVSLPRTTHDIARSPLSETLPQADDLQMVNVLLAKLHEGTRWPIELFRPSGDDTADTSIIQHSYILFVWNEQAVSLNETLESQVENLKYSASWNPRGRFLVVATDRGNEPAHLLAARMCSILWEMAKIVDVAVLIANQVAYQPTNAMSSTRTAGSDRLNLYTWFPFKLGRCGQVQDVILLDEWVFENNGRFSENALLYPAKVPNNFMGCPIRVGTTGIEPYVILTENYTQNDGSIAYKIRGLSVELLNLVCEKMNLTTVFLAPSVNMEFDSFMKTLADLQDGLSDVLTGTVPLMPLFVTSSFDATIPYIHVELKMLLPCPKAVLGTEKVLETFSLSVWLTMGLVLLLTTGMFWCVGNGQYRSVLKQTHTYKSLSHCFYNAWAVFMGVSVPQQPTTSNLRVLFCLYVCYCFAIITVFQAFFVSYLVEPKYEKKFETLDELLDSDLVYGHHPAASYAKDTLSYPEFVKFLDHKKLMEDCSDTRKCVERMITKRDIASFIAPVYATYVAREMGVVDVTKVICSLDEVVLSAGATILFQKGSPLLYRFNVLMRRCLEAGLLEKDWKQLQHGASLRSRSTVRAESSDMFVRFSVSHLKSAFVVLVVGNILSSAVFMIELIQNRFCKRRKIRNMGVRKVRIMN